MRYASIYFLPLNAHAYSTVQYTVYMEEMRRSRVDMGRITLGEIRIKQAREKREEFRLFRDRENTGERYSERPDGHQNDGSAKWAI